jgi:hypothetical protein
MLSDTQIRRSDSHSSNLSLDRNDTFGIKLEQAQKADVIIWISGLSFIYLSCTNVSSKTYSWAGRVAQVAEHPPSKCEAVQAPLQLN